jgi:L-ascorbate metabolism protein UlaG (beta-lactamase superfamily)
MKAELTYIFHNCFILKVREKSFLFDYPADEYLNDDMRALLQNKIAGSDLYVFSSHNHKDHFNRDVSTLGAHSHTITYILSKDIIKKNRFYRDAPESYNIAPDQTYFLHGMEVHSFLSNDAGVAFLITVDGVNIYFGGDLANWDWDGLTAEEHRFLVDYFAEVLMKLKQWPIDIAFSNTDPRLPNWSGAVQFIKTIKPKLFVPMHTFGKTESLAEFLNQNPQPVPAFFHYQKTGDTLALELPF